MSKDAASFCADLVKSHDFIRYASTLFVPAVERRALLALYAFNVEIFRIRDQVSQRRIFWLALPMAAWRAIPSPPN
jgi:phytoene synthase